MSVQFGRWNFNGLQPSAEYVEKVSASLAPYGPDGNQEFSKGGLKILYRPFCTTKESWLEKQPRVSSSGSLITWDGRLDNRTELIENLRNGLTIHSTDVDIVAAAYEEWGDTCFRRLNGDWALSICNPRDHSVILAKDPIGARQLYYCFEPGYVAWCTLLDPLVQFADKRFNISEEYFAGWFSYFPALHLTPYAGVHAVPPASFVRLQHGKDSVRPTVSKYWDFEPGKKVRYRTDAEYEEHFRNVFFKAVQRRLRSDQPILAELSGGMDSASIVCMADLVIARNQAECPRLDTVSWFDDSYDHLEPDTNELHWVTEVEEKRGRSGHHINLAQLKPSDANSHTSLLSEFESEFRQEPFATTPSSNPNRSELLKTYFAFRESQGYRVTLSGVGGSEFLGDGLPSPKQELQDLLVRGHFFAFLRQLKAWSARMRKPQLPVLSEAMRDFLVPFPVSGDPQELRPPLWFDKGFVRRNRQAFSGYLSRVKILGPLPSFQCNRTTLEYMQRLLANNGAQPLNEARYPCFDRDFLEFVFAIPREQIVRLGQRRSLMKRALAGIVPEKLLSRRRKALVTKDSQGSNVQVEAATDSSSKWPTHDDLGQLIGSTKGFIDAHQFAQALQKARRNEDMATDRLLQTLRFECWLRYLSAKGILMSSMPGTDGRVRSPIERERFQAPAGHKSLAG